MHKQRQLSNARHSDVYEELKRLRVARIPDFVLAAEQHLQFALDRNDRQLEALVIFEMCVYYNHVTSQYELSNKYALKCHELAKELNDSTLEANTLRMLGVNYNYLGELLKARDAYAEGIKILESKKELTREEKEILAGLFFNTVTLYKEIDLDETRVNYIDRAFQLFTEIGNKQGIARSYIAYGNNYPGIKNTDRATEYYLQAAEIFRDIGDKRGLGNSLVNIGFKYCLKNDFEKGTPLMQEGIEYLKQSGSAVFVINGYFNLAVCCRLQRKFDESFEYFRMIEEIIWQTKAKFSLANLFEEWAITLEESGDLRGALQYYKLYQEEKELIYKFAKNSAASDAKMMLELDEKKKEARILKKKNTEIEEYSRKLEISNSELQQFGRVASHDLKEPLRMVSLYMQLLDKNIGNRLNEDESEYLKFAKDGADRMLYLIESLLSLSKIDTDIVKDAVDLNVILEEATVYHKPEMDKKNFRLSCARLPKIRVNRAHVLQLFHNLISNAVRYNNSTSPQLDISCIKSENFYYFSFCDNGIGIDNRYREKVFEIFQRLHARNEYSGTGIGLAICKKIVEQMNGKIWVEDGKEGGCNFKFTIPV